PRPPASSRRAHFTRTTRRPARRAGFALLALFIAALVSTLHTLPAVTQAPASLVGFGALAAVALVGLLATERRASDPLLALSLFHQPAFVRAVALGSTFMSCILALLRSYNLAAQSPAGPCEILGVRARAPARSLHVKARKAVVLTRGGFENN